MFPRPGLLAAVAAASVVAVLPLRAGLGEPSYVTYASETGALPLAEHGGAAPFVVSTDDWPGVRRAARDVQADVARVSGARPALTAALPAQAGAVVIAGTIGRSAAIDALVQAGKIDVTAVRGHWESWLTQVVDHPVPGVDRALVIAGSDKRGTIYGLYDLSEQIGVSPWYWWDDVPPQTHSTLYVLPQRTVHPSPSVRYRGIFLNDEAPDLTNWVRATYGDAAVRTNPPVPPGIADYGHAFYARIFEVLLRLRGNCLWPAMWNNAFNEDDPLNAKLADEYGIVMGTSHQEPMLRAQKEWDRRYQKTLGPWNYAQEPGVLQSFWRAGIERNRGLESLVTIGLRGANDTPMAPGGPSANEALLEKIVSVQRQMLAGSPWPQVWCLYKEVQDYYAAGMRVPDDVTLLWAEDNWGDLRRVPTAEERRRSGGAGIYYHFDYHGSPRSYQWLNANPLPKIWDQMALAKQYGADRIWIVNVGHFKGYEIPTEFFLRMAWDTRRWSADNLEDFTRRWAAREFGPEHAAEIAAIVDGYAKFNGRRKPELLAPGTYSLVHYREWETVVAQFEQLAIQAKKIAAQLPPAKRAAFEELVLFPTEASALVNHLYCAAARNALFAAQGRVSANEWAEVVRADFARYLKLIDHYHHDLAGGKWDHFMDEPVFGYTTWRDPPTNSLKAISLSAVHAPAAAKMAVAVEGAASAYTTGATPPLSFTPFARQSQYIEIFRQGTTPFDYTVTPSALWLHATLEADAATETAGPMAARDMHVAPEDPETALGASANLGSVATDGSHWPDEGSATRGTRTIHDICTTDRRVEISVDWSQVAVEHLTGQVEISGAGRTIVVPVSAFVPRGITRESLHGFAESNGYISIEPEHFEATIPAGANRWTLLPGYGRTSSGMRADAPVDAPPAQPGKTSPRLTYRFYVFDPGPATVIAITSPVLNFLPGRPVRYAVSIDDGLPHVVTLVSDATAQQTWAQAVTDNARYGRSSHHLSVPGYHTLSVWMIDPDVILQKIVIDLGGVRSSYLGPPESFWKGD